MSIVISWTKEWSSSDDGTVFTGQHLDDLQTSIENHYHSGGAATGYSRTFSSTDLTSGVLTVTHSLGIKLVMIQIYDNNYKMILPDDVTLINTNSLSVNVSSYTGSTITGWSAKVIA